MGSETDCASAAGFLSLVLFVVACSTVGSGLDRIGERWALFRYPRRLIVSRFFSPLSPTLVPSLVPTPIVFHGREDFQV